jgi:hypothetical protein
MKIKTSKGELQFFDNVETLPIKRYNMLQKYALIDLGVGSDISDIVRHHTRFNQLLELKDYDSLYTENENLMINYTFLLGENNVKGYTLASMLKSVDGQNITVTEDNIGDYVDLLQESDITFGQLSEYVSNLKKKLMNN